VEEISEEDFTKMAWEFGIQDIARENGVLQIFFDNGKLVEVSSQVYYVPGTAYPSSRLNIRLK